jgi:hypothetical protein
MSNKLLNDKENEAADKFMWEHYDRHCGGNNKNAKLELFAEATGIGLSLVIRCPNCNATENISDIESW